MPLTSIELYIERLFSIFKAGFFLSITKWTYHLNLTKALKYVSTFEGHLATTITKNKFNCTSSDQ